MSIPVTLSPRTSLIFEYAHSNSLSARKLQEWANRLLDIGCVHDAIIETSAGSFGPERILPLLMKICRELEIDTNVDFEQLKEDAVVAEYLAGHYPGAAHVLHTCNRLRKSTGFQEQITAAFVYDKGNEQVTYTGLETGITGDELEAICIAHLARNGITRETNEKE